MPRKELDRTVRSQGTGGAPQGGAKRGAETEAKALRAGGGGPAIPVQFPVMEEPGEDSFEEPLPEADESLEIEGLGNLGDILFADGAVSYGVPEDPGLSFQPAGPHGPSQAYQRLVRDPNVSDSTRALVSLVSRLQMLGR